MGTLANTRFAWLTGITVGLLIASTPLVARADDDGEWTPPLQTKDDDAFLEPDTFPGDEGTFTDTLTPGTDGGIVYDPDAPVTNLPDGSVPAPIARADTTNGCECSLGAGPLNATDSGAIAVAVGVATTVFVRRRRSRR